MELTATERDTLSRQVSSLSKMDRHLQETFELRQRSDYHEFIQITLEQAEEAVARAETFLGHTRRALAASER